jgi:hypothetical protein
LHDRGDGRAPQRNITRRSCNPGLLRIRAFGFGASFFGSNRAFGRSRRQQAHHFVSLGKFAEVEARGLVIRRGGFLGGCKPAEVNLLPIDADACSPLAGVVVDAFEPRPALAPVARISCARGQAQIGDAVIRWISVFVIDFSDRVLAMDIKPGEAMSVMSHPVDSDPAVAAPVPGGGFRPGADAPLLDTPIKTSGFRVVVEQLAQAISAQTGLRFACHGRSPSEKKSARQPIEAPGAVCPARSAAPPRFLRLVRSRAALRRRRGTATSSVVAVGFRRAPFACAEAGLCQPTYWMTLSAVMAGLVLACPGRLDWASWPGSSRPPTSFFLHLHKQDVDAPDKRGHGESKAAQRGITHEALGR